MSFLPLVPFLSFMALENKKVAAVNTHVGSSRGPLTSKLNQLFFTYKILLLLYYYYCSLVTNPYFEQP